MKPKNLKSPFSWDERKVLLKDKVLFVPDYYQDYQGFTFPDWADDEVFGNEKPICIEYCSGNGRWIAEKAQKMPDYNWVAIEKRFDRTRKIWSKIKNHNLDNLFVMSGMGQIITKYYISDNSVDMVFVNFPDPWPKAKHAKHRIIQENFISDIARILKPKGSITLVTDDDTYRDQIIDTLNGNSDFMSEYPDPFFKYVDENYGDSYFRDLWERLGRNINYMKFIKK